MSNTHLKKGAIRPLLFIPFSAVQLRLSLFIGLTVGVLTGCGSSIPEPTLIATGYLDNTGSVRIWRKDLNRVPLAIVSDHIPYTDEESRTITAYEYLDGSLSRINRQILSQPEVTEQLRFDDDANLTFNQRIFPDRKEMIDAPAVNTLIYQAQRILQTSAVLQQGGVRLIQGRYRAGVITTCDGRRVGVELNASQQRRLDEGNKTSPVMSLAWLASVAGEEVILITKQDICRTEPTLETL